MVAGLLLALATLSDAGEPSAADRRPNVLFIAVDDLNHWVGFLERNPQTRTPNLDRLAARGVRFSRAYAAAPACNPSRAALMSGRRPHTSGVYLNSNDWRPLIPIAETLVTTFRNAGYHTSGAGKIYHGGFDRKVEWEDYLRSEGPDPLPEMDADKGVGGIRFAPLDCRDEELKDYGIATHGVEFLARPSDRPFFLAVGLHKPHMPWNVPRAYYDLHPLAAIELPPILERDLDDIPPAGRRMAKFAGDHAAMLRTGRWKDAIQGYLAAVSFADAMIGRLLDALDNGPHADNTIIVLWGDHGWHLGEKEHWRKFALWEEATRTPLLWVVPGLTPTDAVCDRAVDLMCIFPTLCDLAGLPTPKHVEGKSIRPLLADPKADWDGHALTTHGYRNHAVRTDRYRLIRYEDGSEELYDHADDPYEWHNLARQSDHRATREALARLLPLPTQDAAPVAAAPPVALDPDKAAKKQPKKQAIKKNE